MSPNVGKVEITEFGRLPAPLPDGKYALIDKHATIGVKSGVVFVLVHTTWVRGRDALAFFPFYRWLKDLPASMRVRL